MDKHSNSISDLVHCEFGGPIHPSAKDDFQHAHSFVIDYYGLIMIYFLRHNELSRNI